MPWDLDLLLLCAAILSVNRCHSAVCGAHTHSLTHTQTCADINIVYMQEIVDACNVSVAGV